MLTCDNLDMLTRRAFTRFIPSLALLTMPNTPRRALVVFEGNSITTLTPHSWPACWPTLFLRGEFAKRVNLRGVNVAVGTDNIYQCFERAPVYVDPLLALCDVGVCVLWEGTNTLFANGFDADKTFDQHMQYCADRKLLGWRTIIGTIISRQFGESPFADPRHENARLRFNQLVRANWREFGAVLDVGADDRLGQQQSAWDASIFIDGIHLAEAGAQRVAEMAAPVIASVLNQQYPLLFPLMLNN